MESEVDHVTNYIFIQQALLELCNNHSSSHYFKNRDEFFHYIDLALTLPYHCLDPTLTLVLSWHYLDIALTLLWPCPDFPLTLPWPCIDLALMTFPWPCLDISLTLPDFALALPRPFLELAFNLTWPCVEVQKQVSKSRGIADMDKYCQDICCLDKTNVIVMVGIC